MQKLLPETVAPCLPARITACIDTLAAAGRIRADTLTEIRLRAGQPASLTVDGQNLRLAESLTAAELHACVTALCRGSVYAHDDTIRAGYIAVGDGVRAGICGTRSGGGVREFTAVSIRIPRAIRGVSEPVWRWCTAGGITGDTIRSVLIYSPPGVGKTTLLRDLAATLAMTRRVTLLDTRGELYLHEMFADTLCDVLTGYGRAEGIELATRTLSPEVIVCDELGDMEEARQILACQHTGVPIIASAHASSLDELLARPGIRLLHESGVFAGYAGIARERVRGQLSSRFACSIHKAAACSV